MSDPKPDWEDAFPCSITISGADGTILYLNDRAAEGFKAEGGKALVGTNLAGCHKSRSNEIIARILSTESPNVYTVEKGGRKKLIFQAPWYEGGKAAGLVELSIPLPENMPHFKRD